MDDYKNIDLNGLKDYQLFARGTAIYPKQGEILGLLYTTLGLAGEAGEVADKTKKLLRDKGGVVDDDYLNAVAAELGDVLWYIANICEELGLEMSDVAKYNLYKLYSRMERDKIHGDGDNR